MDDASLSIYGISTIIVSQILEPLELAGSYLTNFSQERAKYKNHGNS